MISGRFDYSGRPYVQGRLTLPRLHIEGLVEFLVDTGADITSLHQPDVENLRIPQDQLAEQTSVLGVGGLGVYLTEEAVLLFNEGDGTIRGYHVKLAITPSRPSGLHLPSLLGQDVLRRWNLHHDPTTGRLEATVRQADFTYP